ncbi:MAG TPA: SpoIIE family protein phosphatase [Armatimonadota bacterium]|nr:SpoIIE family protein phosphatase [Armatimonadota bacterium]
MRNLSIRHRLALGFGSVVGLMGVVTVSAVILFVRATNSGKAINEDLAPQVSAANSLTLAVDRQRTGLRGYVLTSNSAYLNNYRRGILDEQEALRALRQRLSIPSERAELNRIESLLVQLRQDEFATLSLLKTQGKDPASTYLQKNVRPTSQEISSAASKLAGNGLRRIQEATHQVSRANSRLRNISLTAFLVALSLAVVFILATGRSVTRPARSIAKAAVAIAEGDYREALALERSYPGGADRSCRDELSHIATSIIQMAKTLESRERDLKTAVDERSVANEQLDTRNEELATQTDQLREHNLKLEALTRDLMVRQSITAAALSSLDRNEVMARLLEAIIAPLDLDFGLIMLYNEGKHVLRAAIGSGIEISDPPYELAIGEGFAGKVAKARKIMTTKDVGTESWLDADMVTPGIRRLIGIPLAVGKQIYGVALLGTSMARELSDRETGLLYAFAERAVVAIQRAQAYEMIAVTEENERLGRERLQTIIDNLPEGVIIVDPPDGRIVMANKAALALNGLEALPEVRSTEFNVRRPNGDPIPGELLPTSRSLLHGETCIGEELLIRWANGKEVTVLCNTAPIRDKDGDISQAVSVFQDIAAIKEQQHVLEKIYEDQRTIAETLQKSFLPSSKPLVEGFEIADAYISAQHDAQIGGDFYDLIELGEGLLGVVMGDVSGKGVSAAVHTAMAKYMLRGFAHEDHQPASLLARLNDAVTRYVRGDIFITLFYGVLDTSAKKIVYANGGHEQPILYRSESRECVSLLSSGPAIGVIPGSAYEQFEVELADGDAFVLYTDGITDVRHEKEFLGHDGLSKMVAQVGDNSASQIADRILSYVQEYSHGRLHDDIALLVVKSSNGGIKR